MFGESARYFKIIIIEDYRGFLMALLPPGAFIGLGLIVALKNVVDARQTAKMTASPTATQADNSALQQH